MDEALTNARETQQCADDVDRRMSELGDSFSTRRKEIKERLGREMEDLSREEDSQMEEIANVPYGGIHAVCYKSSLIKDKRFFLETLHYISI